MKIPKAQIKPDEVKRNLTFATTQHGYAINDYFFDTSVSPRQLIIAIATAAILLFLTFFVQALNFWLSMVITTVILVFLVLAWSDPALDRKHANLRAALIAAIGALVLYGVFFFGAWLIGLFLPSLHEYTRSLYALQGSCPSWLAALIIFFIAAPGEELFWRGFVQRNLQAYLGTGRGLALAVIIYALVHLSALNPLLFVAALVGGVFWGLLYSWQGNLFLVMLSHAIWSVLIFVILPLI